MNLLEKLFYYIFPFKHNKAKKSSYSYSIGGNKTYMSGKETLTFTAHNDTLKEQVKQDVEDIYKDYKNNPQAYLDFIKNHGTPIYKIKNADKILTYIGEDEGIIFEQQGLKALIIALITGQGFQFKTQPAVILREGKIEPLSLLHNFYRWYSWYKKLPGFDSKSQKLFKRYMKFPDADLSRLNMDEVIGLQEAIARDKEATAFCLYIARETEGAKNVKRKISEEGGANI